MNKRVISNDLTFLILVRLDSIERLENILLCTSFLNKNLVTKIKVMECSSYNNGLLKKLLGKDIQYSFIEDNDNVLFRTGFLNKMTKSVETKFISIWDADVLVPVDQIVKSVNLLRKGKADFVYPYDNRFLDTSMILRKLFIQDEEIEVLEKNASKMAEKYLPVPVGGAFLANLKSYIDAGLENESFYGWGLEDGERYYRWENLGYKIKRVSGPLFHLSHSRGMNSAFHNADQYLLKRKEIIGIKRKKGNS